MELERDKRNTILASNLSTFGNYLRAQRLTRIGVTVFFIVGWYTIFWLRWSVDHRVLRDSIALLIVLMAGFGISTFFGWALRKEREHAEQSLEVCRSGFIENLNGNAPADLKATALAIGDASRIVNEAIVNFDERERRRNLWSFFFIVMAFAIVAFMSRNAQTIRGFTDASSADIEWAIGLLVIAITFVLNRPRERLELRAFDIAMSSWFTAIANTLEALKKSSITIGQDFRGKLRIDNFPQFADDLSRTAATSEAAEDAIFAASNSSLSSQDGTPLLEQLAATTRQSS